jgi:hypothetical protein
MVCLAPPGIYRCPEGGSDLSAWYMLSGEARLRRCPQVDAILDSLRDLKGDEFDVATRDAGPGAIDLKFRGGSEFTDEGADELDDLLRSLGPHALEPAVFTGEYDGELRVIPLDPADWSTRAPGGIPILGIAR